jgi:hypothetical protein
MVMENNKKGTEKLQIFFKSEETNKLFMNWMNGSPESLHPLDSERFHKFLLALFKGGEELTEEILRNGVRATKKWVNIDYVDEFVEGAHDKYLLIRDFLDSTGIIKSEKD